jgi:hypothetical protein
MRRTILATALLTGLLLAIGALAHEGHRHDAKGTIEAIDETQITLMTVEGAREVLMITEETSFSRGEEATSREDVDAGERAVVMYEKKDGRDVVIEVKLGPKME